MRVNPCVVIFACMLAFLAIDGAQAQQPSLAMTPGGGLVISAGGLVITPITPNGGGVAPAQAPQAGPYTPPYLPQGGVLGLVGVPIINTKPQGPSAVMSPGCPLSVQMIARSWMGQSEYQATNAARLLGVIWRVTRRDGTLFEITNDQITNRVNFEFDQDRLTRLKCG